MSKDLKALRADLARLLGMTYEEAEEDGEFPFLDTCVNTAYRQMFMELEGKRPTWSESNMGVRFKAPENHTWGLVSGSTAIDLNGSPEPDPLYVGSYVRIGGDFYMYAGKDGDGDHHLVEPWNGQTGDHSVRLFHNSVKLPAESIELCETPEALGIGMLHPLYGREAEIRYRGFLRSDFSPRSGIGNTFVHFIQVHGLNQQIGSPFWYYIDASNVMPTYTPGLRMVVYPVPDKDYSVRLRANILPSPLKEEGETPKVPAEAVDEILLPKARIECAGGSKQYNGKNLEFLAAKAREADMRLNSIINPQRRKGGRMRVRPGW